MKCAPSKVSRQFVVAQLGARMHYAVPRILHQAGLLERFYTDLCSAKGWPRLLRSLPSAWLPRSAQRLASRFPEGIPSDRIVCFTAFGWNYARDLARCGPIEANAIFLSASRRFCELVVEQGLGNAGGVYAFNSAALELLRLAKLDGRAAVMEQTIAPKRIENNLLADEARRFPDWEARRGGDHSVAQYAEREAAEWEAADKIFCGSEFVRDSLVHCGVQAAKCVVLPYGIDPPEKPQTVDARGSASKAPPAHLRVLSVGSIGLRKGAPYALEAAKRTRRTCQFRWVGGATAEPNAMRQLGDLIELTGTVPRTEVGRHFQWADVFLLPSLCEGSATATYEALGYGLPVICTPNAGSVVRDGIEGFIVPIRDPDAIVERLDRLAADSDLRARMSQNARARAAEFTVEAYGRRLVTSLES